MPSTLAQKLQIKPGRSLAVLDAPTGFVDTLGLPEGTAVSTKAAGPSKYDVIQVFVGRALDVEKRAVKAGRLLKEGGAFWVAYPKKSAKPKVDTDVTRDQGWDALKAEGWEPVSQIALDATWSALRFKKDEALTQRRAERIATTGRGIGAPKKKAAAKKTKAPKKGAKVTKKSALRKKKSR